MPQLDFYSFQEQITLIIPSFVFFYFIILKFVIPAFTQVLKIRELLNLLTTNKPNFSKFSIKHNFL